MVVFGDCLCLVGDVVLKSNGMRYICATVSPHSCFLGVALVKVLPGLDNEDFVEWSSVLGWEVWFLRVESRDESFGKRKPIRFPSNVEFGSYGWSFESREAADVKFSMLVREGLVDSVHTKN